MYKKQTTAVSSKQPPNRKYAPESVAASMMGTIRATRKLVRL
jgi:hypothetical protein